MDIWLSAALLLVVAALLDGAVTTMIENRQEVRKRKRQNIDGSIHRVTPCGDQQISRQMEPRYHRDDQHQREVLDEQTMVTVETGDVVTGRRIRLFSRVLFPVLFLVFIVVYWFHFSPKRQK